ncbi:MAG: hypothetical protein J6V99_08620 [Neisseriaceae bacterium]|nr:hypothetical protein [Neisseriaceae bacterium]
MPIFWSNLYSIEKSRIFCSFLLKNFQAACLVLTGSLKDYSASKYWDKNNLWQ